MLHTDFFNEPKTSNGVTIQYLADEDCFLFNGTVTNTFDYCDRSFLIPNAIDKNFAISATYVSGEVTVPTGKHVVAYIGYAKVIIH